MCHALHIQFPPFLENYWHKTKNLRGIAVSHYCADMEVACRCVWTDLPVEIQDLILYHVVTSSKRRKWVILREAVLSRVCREWKDRKPSWCNRKRARAYRSALRGESLTAKAASVGNLSLLKWLRDNGCHWDKKTCKNAAENGHLEVLKWLRENGCDWDSGVCFEAALGGHFEVLKWARENGCTWNDQTVIAAATAGRIDILEWLLENGCQIDDATSYYAATAGKFEVVRWCVEQKYPFNPFVHAVAAEKGDLDLLKWL